MDLSIERVVVGQNKELYNVATTKAEKLSSIEAICVFYKDGSAKVETFEDAKDFDKFIKDLADKGVSAKNNNLDVVFTDSKYYKKAYKEATKEQTSLGFKKALAIIGLSTVGATTLVGGSAYTGYQLAQTQKEASKEAGKDDNQTNDNNITEDVLSEIPDVKDKDWDFYLANAIATFQFDIYANITDWLSMVNGLENWERVTLSEEQMQKYNSTDNEAIFGFTAEDAYSLLLRFVNLSKEDYVTITGGKNFDAVKVMDDSNSVSNGALRGIINYYISSDECNLHIDTLINFNDSEVAQINKFETMFREFHALEKEGKDAEAEAKMREIKSNLVEFAHDTDFDQSNAKSYILRTFAEAGSFLSEARQYKDTVLLNVYDTKKQENTTVEIKTSLFDELTMRDLVLGYDETFDSEAYLTENKVDAKRYDLLNIDTKRSIADLSCGAQSARLEEANQYISTLRQEDMISEAAYSGSTNSEIGNNVNTKYDELTRGTYDFEVLNNMLDDYLRLGNKYPKNREYFSNFENVTKNIIEYKDTHGVTQGKKGDKIVASEEHKTDMTASDFEKDAIYRDENGNVISREEAMKKARDEENKKKGTIDAGDVEEETRKIEKSFQEVYDAIYNALYNGTSISDEIKASKYYDAAYKLASEDVAKRKELEKQQGISGGEVKPVTPSNPVTPTEPTTPTDPVTPSDPTTPSDPGDGFSDKPPVGYNPVVDSTDQDIISQIESLSEEEWNQIFELTTDNQVETSSYTR